jgi:hypothetical protein
VLQDTVKVVDGVATEVEPNFAVRGMHPADGKICVKPYGLLQKLYNPHRVLKPMRRTNPRKGRNEDGRPRGLLTGASDARLSASRQFKKLEGQRAQGPRLWPTAQRFLGTSFTGGWSVTPRVTTPP